eukprot:TRINITY_DN10871_c0_g1_i2.p1 TRINITY_DN10871_c0_g1~~TRINITY_DN10871_c0_g1_i2.p1  ORF type:complete len:244 (+),score=46.07 TRINITY_DN10871_c0_g1_i2:372-1103(+)
MSYIDLFQVHWPVNLGLNRHHDSWPDLTGVVAALGRAKAAKKIRHWGVCNFGTADMQRLREGGGTPVTNQLPYNLLWRGIECGIAPRCVTEGVGVLCYSPLQQGLLGGRREGPLALPGGRRRTRFFREHADERSRHGGPGAEQMLFGPGGVLRRLQDIAQSEGIPLAKLATAWLLSRPGVACVVVGASTAQQARRNAKLASVSAAALESATQATEDLKRHFGGAVDQYARVPRVHGNSWPARL